MKQFFYNECTVIISNDGGMLHLSISHPLRNPTWEEIRNVRYKFLPDEKTFAMLLPPKNEYVNVHQYCFHLWELRDN